MKIASLGKLALIGFSVFLYGCDARIEQPVGDIIPVAPEMAGKWMVKAASTARDGKILMTVAVNEDGAILCTDEDGTMKGNLYKYHGKEYFSFALNEKGDEHIIFQVKKKSKEGISLRALDAKRAETLLDGMKLPVVHNSYSHHSELYLDKKSFGMLMSAHDKDIFANGPEVVLSRMQ